MPGGVQRSQTVCGLAVDARHPVLRGTIHAEPLLVVGAMTGG